MYKTSAWAKNHVIAARLLLALLHISLFISALLLCRLLAARNLEISFGTVLPVCIAGGCVVLAIGHFRKMIHDRQMRFYLQKFRFLIIGICAILLIIGLFSSGAFLKFTLYNHLNGAFTEAAAKKERPVFESYKDKKLFYEDLKEYYSSFSKRELRKEFRHQLKNLAHRRSDGGDTAKVVLIILGMLIALYFVIGLSCSLSCSGSDALAAIVLIVGAVGVIWLAVLLIKRTLKKKRDGDNFKIKD